MFLPLYRLSSETLNYWHAIGIYAFMKTENKLLLKSKSSSKDYLVIVTQELANVTDCQLGQ
jgi:hypothetical protein